MDIKILFQSLYINMTRFKKEPDVFKRWKEETREANKIHSVNPKSVYRDTLVSIMSNHHPRAISLTNPAVLEKVDYDKIIRLHKERFGNARDFTFVITGNLNEDSIRLLVETWIGGLPSFNITESIKDNGIFPPKGIVKNHFTKKMETPQSTITIGYTGKIPLTMENKVKMEFMSNILQTIYLEQIREKEGGAYGVGVQGQSPKFSTEPYIFQVSFDTDPNPVKKEKLIGIVYEEIKNMMKQGPTQEMVEKVRENFLKNYSDQRKKEDAFYWFGVSSTYVVFGLDTRNTYEKVVSEITPSQLQDFAKEIFTQGNIIEVVMDPTK
jgi:zinc protease